MKAGRGMLGELCFAAEGLSGTAASASLSAAQRRALNQDPSNALTRSGASIVGRWPDRSMTCSAAPGRSSSTARRVTAEPEWRGG